MMNDWLLEVKSRGFLLRPHFGASPFVRSPARPPLLRRAGRIFFGWGLAQRLVYSLNKFRNSLSPLPKYSKQIIHFCVLLFQIVNLQNHYHLVTKGLLACPHNVRATHKRPRWSVFIVLICGQVQLPYVAMTKTRRASFTIHNSPFIIHHS